MTNTIFELHLEITGGENIHRRLSEATNAFLVRWFHESEAHVLTANDDAEKMLARAVKGAILSESFLRMEKVVKSGC